MNLKEKEVLTAEEYELVAAADPRWAVQYLFRNFWNNTYLNLAIYSEADKEARDLQLEQGL